MLAVLDLRPSEGLAAAGLARELVNRVQKLRKSAGLVVTDAVHIYYRAAGEVARCLDALHHQAGLCLVVDRRTCRDCQSECPGEVVMVYIKA